QSTTLPGASVRWLLRHLLLFRLLRLARIAGAIGFPDHEFIQRLPAFVRDKSDHDRVIDEAKKRSHIRNQVEWIDHIVETSYNPCEVIIRNLLVFTALVGADQSQHCLEIRPIALEPLPRERRRLFCGFFKERAQTAGTSKAQFCFLQGSGEGLAAQGWFLI